MFEKINRSWYMMRDNDAAVDAALINASSQALTQMSANLASGQTNKETRSWNWDMYNQQRFDYLTDLANNQKYNDPSQQMIRLKNAGLNPNLVYGHGADAMVNQAPQSTHPGDYKPIPKRFAIDGASILNSYQDARQRTAQIDQTTQAIAESKANMLLTAAKTGQVVADTDLTKFTTDQKRELDQTYQTAMALANDKTATEIDTMRATSARAAELQAQQILTMIQQRHSSMLTNEQVKQATELLKKDNRIRELDAQLADKGIRPNDGAIWKIIQDILNQVGSKAGETLKNMSPVQKFKNYLEWDKPWKERSWQFW